MVECHICQKHYPREVGLKLHLRWTHKLVNLTCEHCNRTFEKVPQLRTHIKDTHERDNDAFSCDQCEYKTWRKSLLKNHIESLHLEIFM